jgi:tripartite-type tricarboxylate transporter receptor subunit TctC
MRALAISSPRRHSEYPDVPTFRERGVDATMGVWRGIMLPKGTPSNVVTAWRDLTRKITAEPRFQEALKKQNVSVVFEGGDAFKTVLKDDNDIFKRLVPIIRASNK